MNRVNKYDRLWSIVLSGGEGERMKLFIQQWLGNYKPKQYCTFVGTRSMFQHTLDRADRLAMPDRKVTVIARAHQGEVCQQLGDRSPGTIVLQPRNLNTVAGIFLPLTHVRARDPQATVVIYPSDHFVYPEDRFVEAVERTALAAEWLVDRLVLLGVVPDRVELDYGWIQPGKDLGWTKGCRVQEVGAFLKKPGQAVATASKESRALWNTMVMAAKVETLWKLGWRCFPKMMPFFEMLGQSIGTSHENAVLNSIYRLMPILSFSSDLLEQVADQVAVMELKGVLWSDWGRPERIIDSLRRIGKQPTFPLEHLVVDKVECGCEERDTNFRPAIAMM